MAKATTLGESDLGYDMSLWYDSRPLKIGWFAMLAAVGSEVVFQRVFGFSHGLDSMTPEFENVWMGLWRFNVIANIIYRLRDPGVDLDILGIATWPTWIPRQNSNGIFTGWGGSRCTSSACTGQGALPLSRMRRGIR